MGLHARQHLGAPLGKWWSTNCQVHNTHVPAIHSTAIHHIQPMALGGKDVPKNRIEACPTGHVHIHMLIDMLMDFDGVITREQTRGFSRKEISLAREGYEKWVASGRPKGRTE